MKAKYMTQLSKFPIEKDVYFDIRDDFLWTITKLQSPNDTKSFFYDFFTKTERVMFSKRLAIALLVYQKYDYRNIQRLLHVSTATISRIAQWIDKENNGIRPVLDKLLQEERVKEFFKKVNTFIDKTLVNPWKSGLLYH